MYDEMIKLNDEGILDGLIPPKDRKKWADINQVLNDAYECWEAIEYVRDHVHSTHPLSTLLDTIEDMIKWHLVGLSCATDRLIWIKKLTVSNVEPVIEDITGQKIPFAEDTKPSNDGNPE